MNRNAKFCGIGSGLFGVGKSRFVFRLLHKQFSHTLRSWLSFPKCKRPSPKQNARECRKPKAWRGLAQHGIGCSPILVVLLHCQHLVLNEKTEPSSRVDPQTAKCSNLGLVRDNGKQNGKYHNALPSPSSGS